MQLGSKLDGEFVRPAVFVERDRLADGVQDHLAGVAAGHVLLKRLADGRINRAIHVFIQLRQHFFALHISIC